VENSFGTIAVTKQTKTAEDAEDAGEFFLIDFLSGQSSLRLGG
jgi:hypothetical protein